MSKVTQVLKSKTLKVYKNKKLNNANFGDYTLNDYKVFLHLITKIGGVDEMGKYLQHDQITRVHTLTAKEFREQFGGDLKNIYKVLQQISKKIARTALTIEKPDLFETWEVPVCQNAKYNKKEGSLTIKFNEDIMPYLMQVKRKFVLYNLKDIANFGSLYTTRLYELIQEFKDTGYLYKTIDQLRHVFAVGNRYKLYGDFKRKTFAHAVNEINNQYEMDLTFEEIRTGRKITAIAFNFNPTTSYKALNPRTGNMCNVYNKIKKKPNEEHSTCTNQQELLGIDLLEPDNNTQPQPHDNQTTKPNSSISTKDKKIIKRMNAILQANPSIDLKDALSQARSEFDA